MPLRGHLAWQGECAEKMFKNNSFNCTYSKGWMLVFS